MSAERIRCTRHYCEGYREPMTDGRGHAVLVCPLCARNKRGLCRDCSHRLAEPHAMRCPRCAKARKLALERSRDRVRYVGRRARVLAHHRARRAIPEVHAHKLDYLRAYRAAHPRDALDRLYQRHYMAVRRSDPAYRERQNARKRELRALRRTRDRAPSAPPMERAA